ncbi:chemotaxis protein CheD [Formivibrio citricus]|uniref:Probable chemoreceptor glutamine deamidase CheD n=1 Tax=Formivibrio citricus TaxID=83765 RepID=A0A1I4VCS1_9NEIS|nr:hypothetical protein [Formivibrio citricus]SFM98964.1 chemotaxis protein CheD [Formivibrio citricus]
MNKRQEQGEAKRGAYLDPRFRLPLISLMPGEFQAGRGETGFTTLLGSCVAACIWDQDTGIGGMNHFLLPDSGDIDPTHAGWAKAARYGDHAMELLINKLIALGARREHLCAKLFGGGAVLAGSTSLIGERNAEFARRYLEIEGIQVMAQDLGGPLARQAYFFPANGEAFVRRITGTNRDLVMREIAFAKQLQQEETQGSVFLF